jgi:integrase
MLSKAVEWKLMRIAPKIRLAKVRGRDALIDPKTESVLIEELQQPIKHPRTQRLREQLRDVLIIAQDSGMRPSEIFRIRIEHIDWSGRRIWNPYGKTDKARCFVGMSERMETVLSAHCGQRCDGWLFPSDHLKTGHINSVAVGFRALRRRTGVNERIVPYSARHTYGTYALEATGNTFTMADSMGSDSLQSMKPYHHTASTLCGTQSTVAVRRSAHVTLLKTLERRPLRTKVKQFILEVRWWTRWESNPQPVD